MLSLFWRTSSISVALLTALVTQIGFNRSAAAREINTPSCYMQLADGSTRDLSYLCATQKSSYYIDLDRDDNRDGVPDGLAEAVKRIESSQDKQAAVQEFHNRLPISPQTRALIQQRQTLSQQLIQNRDSAQTQQIFNQLRAMDQQIMSDRNYQRVMQGMQQIFAPRRPYRDR